MCQIIKTMCNNLQRRNNRRILKERNLQFQTETRNKNGRVKNVQVKVNCRENFVIVVYIVVI